MAATPTAGIDASIALNSARPAAVPAFNMLTSMGQVAQTGNALLQGRQLQMQLAGRNALIQAYQGVPLDPDTGLPNSQQLISNLQKTPGGAYVLPQVIQSLQESQKRQYDLAAQQQTQTTTRTNTVNGALNPLLRLGNNVTSADIFSTMAGLHASGFNTDAAVADAAATLPTRQPGQDDASYGAQLNSWVVNHASRSWGADTQASKFTPSPTTTDAGGQIITRDTNPYTNPAITSASPITRTMSPAEQAGQVKGPPGPGGAPTVIPASTYAQQNGMGHLVPGAPPASPFGNGGRFPAPLLNPNNPRSAQPPGYGPPPVQPVAAGSGGQQGYAPPLPPAGASPPYTPPGQAAPASGYAPPAGTPALPPAMSQPGVPQQPGAPMVVGLAPAQQTGLDTAGKASADQWAAQQNLVGGSAARMYQLHSALSDLQSLGPTGTGPSAGTINTVKSYLSSLPIIGQSLGIDPNTIADYDKGNKALTAYAAARAGARGGTTDSQLATTLSSNASMHISNLASTDVVKANLGLERMDQAQIAGFQRGFNPATGQTTGQPMTPDQYSDYSSRFNTNMDPRAFIAPELSAQQFSSTVAGMQPAERQKFQNTFNTALQNGWIEQPGWMQQPAQTAPSTATAPASAATPAPAAAPAATPQQPAIPVAAPAQAAPLPLSVNGNGQPAIAGGY